MTPGMQRKLAALFAADVAGYSRLMALDEEFTTRTLAHHREVMDALIARHGGRIANTAGDSVLAEFPSSVEAVRCAVEVQEALTSENAQILPDRQVQFRIGIGVGDVIQRGEDLLGDGVNVAARLESLAAPGGICVSGDVRDQIEGKLTLRIRSLGAQRLKNIPRPVQAYQIGGAQDATLSGLAVARNRLVSGSMRLWVAALICLGGLAALAAYHHLRSAPGDGVAAAREALEHEALEAQAQSVAAGRTVLRTEAFNGRDYALVAAPDVTWAEAEAEARALGGNLVSITAPDEEAFIAGLIGSEDKLWQEWKPGHDLGPWIGLIRPQGDGPPEEGWVWVTGEPAGFTNWYERQPDNLSGHDNVARYHRWNDARPPAWGDAANLDKAPGYIVEFD